MSKHSFEFELDLAKNECMLACLHAADELDWIIQERTDSWFRSIERSRSLRTWRAKALVELKPLADFVTIVRVFGSIYGFGPIQSGHLKEQMNRFRAQAEIAAQTMLRALTVEMDTFSPS